jgi:hypothetical protein
MSFCFSKAKRKYRIIKEVPTDKGTPGASSEYNPTTYAIKNAFVHTHSHGWSSKSKFGDIPQIIWYRFRQRFVLAEVTFRSNSEFCFRLIITCAWSYNCHANNSFTLAPILCTNYYSNFNLITFLFTGVVSDTPTSYQIVASNDKHCGKESRWTILCEDIDGEKVTSRYQIKRCVVEDTKKRFKCFGIRILGTSLNKTAYVGVGNVRFFKNVNP